MKWKLPPKIKIYEALGCLADKRIKIKDAEARVYSSSRKKFYVVRYDENKNAIMANDNASYWRGYLGYPSIAYLMLVGKIKFNPEFAQALANIKWKDINTKFKNDFSKTEEYIKDIIKSKGVNIDEFDREIGRIYRKIKSLKLNYLGNKIAPPRGY